jgi:hypothetical protein
MSKRGNAIFNAGLCVLGIAFISSSVAGFGTIGEELRTVGTLKFNPDITSWVWVILTLGVLPIAAGLALLIIPFVLREKTGTKGDRLFYLFLGGLSVACWSYGFFQIYISYTRAISWAAQTNVTNITNSLNGIYIGYECVDVLWLASGVFLLVASVYAKNQRQLTKNAIQA